ncbi:MAG: SDR family oxidoreductase [Alcanivoracaceae bacterium]|nr:SDR family oxidoreductase [Alcanivoracaceae bacterium]
MKTALITGANRGIGLELAKQLQQKQYHVIVACRKSSEELEVINCQIETEFDVADVNSVQKLADKLKDQKLDLLINNAGILESMSLDNLNYDAMRRQYEINTLGPLRVTERFLPNLSKGSKIAIITSRMGSLTDNTSGGQYGYRISKAAVNMVGCSLAQDLKPKGIAVALLHPGYVRTGMTGNNGLINAAESAGGLIERIAELDMNNTGGFWHTDGTKLPW